MEVVHSKRMVMIGSACILFLMLSHLTVDLKCETLPDCESPLRQADHLGVGWGKVIMPVKGSGAHCPKVAPRCTSTMGSTLDVLL